MLMTLSTLMVQAAVAQDTSTQSSTQSGTASVSTEIKSGEVVYVAGDDLVVKTDDGQVKHFTVPDDFKFQVDGKEVGVHDLTPGMRLTRTVTTTSVPETVKTVRTITGTVWHVNAPNSVILKLPDNTNKQYNVPKGQTFDINGKKTDVFGLRKGMKVTATVITETPSVTHTTAQTVSGQAPAPPPPETPPVVGVLLIEREAAPADAQEAPTVAKAKLPQTASSLPLIGMLGMLFIGASVLARIVRLKKS
jgi:hypothetical protein